MSVNLMYERLLQNQQQIARDLQQNQQAGFRQLQEESRAETKRLADRLEFQVAKVADNDVLPWHASYNRQMAVRRKESKQKKLTNFVQAESSS